MKFTANIIVALLSAVSFTSAAPVDTANDNIATTSNTGTITPPVMSGTENAGVVDVSPVYITTPGEGDKITRGSSVTVSWINPVQGIDKVEIHLMKGNPSNLETVAVLAKDVDISKEITIVDIPKDISTGPGYAIAVGIESQWAYIGRLIVVDAEASNVTDTLKSPAINTQPQDTAPSNISPNTNDTPHEGAVSVGNDIPTGGNSEKQ